MVTNIEEIWQQVDSFHPRRYGATRNFKSGSVSRLSPYISRGVLSTRKVYDNLARRFSDLKPFEKFIQELAWRDYWQRVWQENDIDEDIKQPQENISHFEMPEAIVNADTGIEAVDDAIQELYETGYMHNHMRMYVASIVCNVGQCYWKEGARWMYAHLLDADWGSNALSWQWVAGSNSSKKYYANQENINKYFDSDQRNTFLDHSYEYLLEMPVPDVLKSETPFNLDTVLPDSNAELNPELPTLVYTHYNLDPKWHKDLTANRVLLLEPSHFTKYPISRPILNFILKLAENIEGIQILSENFKVLKFLVSGPIIYKEHPFCRHFEGRMEERDWLHADVPLEKSFFRYWKSLKKSLPEIA